MKTCRAALLLIGSLALAAPANGAPPGVQEKSRGPQAAHAEGDPHQADGQAADQHAKDQQALFKKFEQTLAEARLVGHFTILGQDPGPLREEEYTIRSVTKLDEGDFWLIRARIRYGEKDITAPLPLEVKWAGDTPVITLTNLTIPGLGTFSSRVVIHDDKYAGTWSHGKIGGHLFGTIQRIKEADPEGEESSSGGGPLPAEGR